MADILIWLLTIVIAFIVLRYIPINLPMKGRMILWLSGCLISSLAVLATITYTFGVGVLAALLLGLVCSVFLQSKVPYVFDGEKENANEPVRKEKSNSTDDEFDFWNRDTIEDEDLVEEDTSKTDDESFPDGEIEGTADSVVNEEKGEDNDKNLLDELEKREMHNTEKVPKPTDMVANTEKENKESEEPSLMEEELVRQRINEDILVEGNDIEETIDGISDEELMSARNIELNFDQEDLSLESLKTAHDGIKSGDNEEWNQPESERELRSEVVGPTNSDKDIPQEMNRGSIEDIDESIINPDVEDEEDSLVLDMGNGGKLVADEGRRKQLFELMIEKIEGMEEQMNEQEYEAFVKAHLSEALSDLEYYFISKYLIRFYMKQGKVDDLELFTHELIDKFSSYSLIVEELKYVIHHQVP